ncbi:YcgN family cysteine cluster protein [Beggiatoa alba]|nr:YcgN family cysteine cluster protein [Beggiatoa alba]
MKNDIARIISSPLEELSEQEWEALCDHCGRCCLIKLEDDQTNEVFYTNMICRMYDIEKGGCSCYSNRKKKIAECIVIKDSGDEIYSQLPETCAYRLRYNNKPLPDWHPLIAGDTQKMQQAGLFVKHRVVSEVSIHEEQFEEHIIDDIQ